MKLLGQAIVLLVSALVLAGCAGTNVAPAGYINAADFRTCLLTMGKGEAGSINASAISALNDGKKRLGVAEHRRTVESPAKIDKAIAHDISINCSLIIGVGEAFVEPLMEQAKYHRARHFALLLPPGTTAQATRENLAVITYDLSQPAYVAGFIAAGTSASGQVAVIAGEKNPTNQTLLTAFAKGVARYNTEQNTKNSSAVKANVKPGGKGLYLGKKPPVSQIKSRVEGLVKQGADVIFFAEGVQSPAGLAVIAKANQDREKAFEATEEGTKNVEPDSGDLKLSPSESNEKTIASPTVTERPQENDAVGSITAIWYLTDGHETQANSLGQNPPVLTSVVPDLSQAMISLIEQARKDRFASNSTQILGTYKNGWVRLAPFYEYDSTVPNEVKKKSQIIEEEFRQGTLKI
ncbi:BMP family lipoprotein [Varibaculum vaginae]|uniref:BMP family lipoprotein n=1 Tax=Varibaculum vaginae TaxID=2364797 RepID=UPI000F083DDA|nr:BMP family ABC transporter substrate-binding protein [Varibaculum vaginae]